MAVRQCYGSRRRYLGLRLYRLTTSECTDKEVVRNHERIGEGVLRWFGHVEMMEKDETAKRVYVGECAGSLSVDRPRKKWVDTVEDCLRKRGLDVRQARRIVQYRSEWRGIVTGNA